LEDPGELTTLFGGANDPGSKIKSVARFSRLLLALIYLISGCILGVLLLEGVLRSNSTLLQRGLAVPASVDRALTIMSYDVHYSDADVFYWRPDLIRPLPGSTDRLESRVTFETDEFGFRNAGPISANVDVVVLGRSISLAGHLAEPWPDLLEKRLNWRVFNLSQPGSGIKVKREFLDRFGLSRHPQWVIVEVVPSIDFVGDHSVPLSFSQQMVVPVLQQLTRQWMVAKPISTDRAIYPLSIDLPDRRINLTCCLHYLDFFSLDIRTLEQSQDWAHYRQELLKLVNAARSGNACVALLYVPTKPDVYFPLAQYPEQLNPTLRDFLPLHLDADGWIKPDPDDDISVEQIRQNALVGRDLVESFALENGLLWIDPGDGLSQSVLAGQDPFMVYDSHWNQLGHQIIAETIIESLQKATCP